MNPPNVTKRTQSAAAGCVQRVVLRRVVKWEYVGACRYTGYVAKSIKLTLECGHENYRKASQGVPVKAKCLECTKPQNDQAQAGGV